MPSPSDTLIAIGRSIVAGQRLPVWTVTTTSGHLVGLLSEHQMLPRLVLLRTVRAQTMASLVEAGLVELGEEEPVPEYEGFRPGLHWEPGRTGCRLVVTDAGRDAAGPSLPRDLPWRDQR